MSPMRLLTLLLVICLLDACAPSPSPVPAASEPAPPEPAATAEPFTPEPATPEPADTAEPATPEPAVTSTPVGSLTGRIVFYSHRDGNIEIYTMNPDGSDQRRLTFNESDDYSPAWSPDGLQIAFISDREDPNPGNCSHSCFYQLYVINSDGSGERKLIATEFSTLHPDWHPNGAKISFDTESNLQGDIYVVNVDGSGLQLLIEDGFWADWSPDGSQIVFASKRDGNVELYLADADGGNQRRLTQNGKLDYFPDWSPDSRRIAFTVMEDKAIYIMDTDGSHAQRLTPPGNAENPAWSPDGTWIAYQSSNDGDFEIYRINVDAVLDGTGGASALQLTDNNAGDLWVSWGLAAQTGSETLLAFEKSGQTFASIPTWKIGLADLDADGDLDAAFANSLENSSQIWLNDGSGTFADSGQLLGQYGHGIAVGDVDGDGDPDMVITTHEYLPTRVYLNDGKAIFEELKGAFEETTGHSVDLFDMDGDGDLDAVGEGSGRVRIFWNNGDAKFSASEREFPTTAAWEDMDADGDVDLLLKEDGVGYTVYLNDGGGDFHPGWIYPDPNAMEVGDVAFGDVDRDGDLDAVVANGHHQSSSHPAQVFINNGSGQFTGSGQRLSIVTNAGVSLGDLDKDGDLDLVLTDYLHPCQIWLNDGNGQFADSGIRFGDSQFYRHAHLGDLDGDGDLDIFLATFGMNQGPNEIWFNLLISNETESP